jgi:hypothetical protein
LLETPSRDRQQLSDAAWPARVGTQQVAVSLAKDCGVEAHALSLFVDRDLNLNVKALHADFLLDAVRLFVFCAPGLHTGVAQAPLSAWPQQFSVRYATSVFIVEKSAA